MSKRKIAVAFVGGPFLIGAAFFAGHYFGFRDGIWWTRVMTNIDIANKQVKDLRATFGAEKAEEPT